MKDIVDVNIAGIAFKLDAEAFALLDGYLYKIRERYGSSPDGNEILEDIEARIAELILSQQDAGTVVRKPLVESAIHQLGAPEEFAEMAPEEERADEASVPPPYRPEKLARRLYRNPEGRKLGGICSGLGAYFNADVTLIRLLFLLPFFLMTFFYAIGWHDSGKAMNALFVAGLFLYILLWIVIPKARTPRQKLEMKGEKITTSRIEQTFREEFARTAPNTDARTQVRHERNASVFAELVSVLGKILLFLVKALVAFFALILSVAIIAVLVAIVSAIAGSVSFLGPDLHFPYPAWTLTDGGLIVLLPLLLLLYGHLDHCASVRNGHLDQERPTGEFRPGKMVSTNGTPGTRPETERTENRIAVGAVRAFRAGALCGTARFPGGGYRSAEDSDQTPNREVFL